MFYALCHTEMGEDIFKADGNKNHLPFVVNSANGYFFFFMMGMRPKIPWNVAT